jgi:anti-sigma regulatory factor (Ser/Thr protein kinase)
MSVMAPTRPLQQSSPSRRHHAALPADPRAVARARRLVRAAVRFWDVPVDAETAALLTSELVTNAVTHDSGRPGPAAGATIMLTITGSRDRLRVEVHDACLAPPVVNEAPGADAEHGRGMLLVNMLASTWGCDRLATGKLVYFTLTAEGF